MRLKVLKRMKKNNIIKDFTLKAQLKITNTEISGLLEYMNSDLWRVNLKKVLCISLCLFIISSKCLKFIIVGLLRDTIL